MSLDVDGLYKSIDEYNLGYISTNMLSKYMSMKCGYKINENEVPLILSRYDKDGDYKISYDEFRNEVSEVEIEGEGYGEEEE